MLKISTYMMMAAVAVVSSNFSVAQDCGSCASCSSGGYAADSNFSYPGASCGCGGRGGRMAHHREKLDAMRAESAKITARNDAWPKPFACADRQVYHDIFSPMIDQGFEEQCCLSNEHFDASTNELNQFGVSTVAGIMQNMPSNHKHVFIHRDSDQDISQARLNSVNSMVRMMYGQMAPNAQVAFSNKQPSSVPGVRAETITNLFNANTPKPIIPISQGQQSVGQSVGN